MGTVLPRHAFIAQGLARIIDPDQLAGGDHFPNLSIHGAESQTGQAFGRDGVELLRAEGTAGCFKGRMNGRPLPRLPNHDSLEGSFMRSRVARLSFLILLSIMRKARGSM